MRNDLVRIDEPNSVDATTQILREVRTHGRWTSGEGRLISGAAIRTKMSCSDGRATSNWRIRVRPISAASRSWGSPRHRTSWRFPWSLISSMPVEPVEGVRARLGPQPDRVVAVGRLDLVERAVEHLAAPEDHEDPVAEPLGDRHVVRGEDHGRPGLPQVEHRVLEDLGVDRVEPAERLVEDQQLGPVEHRRR